MKFKNISSKEHFKSLKLKLYTNEQLNSGSIITSAIKWEVGRHIFVNTASITGCLNYVFTFIYVFLTTNFKKEYGNTEKRQQALCAKTIVNAFYLS